MPDSEPTTDFDQRIEETHRLLRQEARLVLLQPPVPLVPGEAVDLLAVLPPIEGVTLDKALLTVRPDSPEEQRVADLDVAYSFTEPFHEVQSRLEVSAVEEVPVPAPEPEPEPTPEE